MPKGVARRDDEYDGDEKDEAYLNSLAEVEAASAKLEQALKQLSAAGSPGSTRTQTRTRDLPAPSQTRTKKPIGARTRVDRTDAGTLLVEVRVRVPG